MIRLLVMMAVAAISALLAADVSGKWMGTVETNGSRVPISLTLNQNGDGVSGTVVTGDDTGQVPIQKAELRGDELAFEVRDNADRLVNFRLKLSNMTMAGEASVQGQVSKVSLSLPGRGGDAELSQRILVQSVGPAVRAAGGVSAPTVVKKVQPDYTDEARAAKVEGTVVLVVEIDPTGMARNIRVVRSLGLGLDERCAAAYLRTLLHDKGSWGRDRPGWRSDTTSGTFPGTHWTG